MANSSTNDTARQAFLSLAISWERLASELYNTQLILEAMEAIPPQVVKKGAAPEPESSPQFIRNSQDPREERP
jgi:hypothetical protein